MLNDPDFDFLDSYRMEWTCPCGVDRSVSLAVKIHLEYIEQGFFLFSLDGIQYIVCNMGNHVMHFDCYLTHAEEDEIEHDIEHGYSECNRCPDRCEH